MDEVLQDMLRAVVEDYCKANNVEVHEIRIYGYYSSPLQKVRYAVKVDVRKPGQQMLGASS
jgi:hypothetical protein